jgi:UDP-N-acetylmuramate dehydrogenase
VSDTRSETDGGRRDEEVTAALTAAISVDRVARHALLAPLTTFKVGGAADWLVQAQNASDVRHACAVALAYEVPVRVLGGGSNVLVADGGVRGIVVWMHGGEARLIDSDRVRADAGMTINGLVRWTVSRGYAGLEAWAGTPGTVGGAIFGNAHFEGCNIGDLVDAVELLETVAGTFAGKVPATVRVPAADLQFGYDSSRLQRTGEIVISADFLVQRGDPAALRAIARKSLAFRKRTQPLEFPSAGCIFQNPDPRRDDLPPGIPPSAGALIDRAGLKGAREGGARVSPAHANFIVNEGGATAADVRTLIERCRDTVRRRFGVELRDEIVLLGF